MALDSVVFGIMFLDWMRRLSNGSTATYSDGIVTMMFRSHSSYTSFTCSMYILLIVAARVAPVPDSGFLSQQAQGLQSTMV